MDNNMLQAIGNAIGSADRFTVVTHIRPDGDAIGSLLGLGLALMQLGKPVQMVCSDKLPGSFRYLAGSELVSTDISGSAGMVFVVDCSDIQRGGKALAGIQLPDANIDHHVTNLNFARLNHIVPSAVATTEILADCLKAWGLQITPDVAAALLTGLVTDTLGFRTSNISPKALRLAAALIEAGASLSEIYLQALALHSFEATRLWGSGLSRLEREGRMVWTSLTAMDRKAVGYQGKDDADLINLLSAIDQADISLVFVEQTERSVKVSWRSTPGYDVSKIALQFGGGGHPAASGAEIAGSLAEVCQQVLDATRQILVN